MSARPLNAALQVLTLSFVACRAPVSTEPQRPDPRINVKSFGAIGDGRADDTDALLQALATACGGRGGVLYVPTGVYRHAQTLRVVSSRCSNLVIEGDGAGSTLHFQPHGASRDTFNDRAFYLESEVSPLLQIAGPIAVGDTSFTLVDPAAASKLLAGQWLVVSERDDLAKEIVVVDWTQVERVNATTVHVRHPFRTAFSTSRRWSAGRSGLGVQPILSLLENVTIRDLRIVHEWDEVAVPLINVGMAIRTRISDVTLDNARGNGVGIYRAKDVTITNLQVLNAVQQANEIAASVDVRVASSSLGFEQSSVTRGVSADTAALTVDFGSAFFTITNNSLHSAGNIGVAFLDGVHDGVFAHNVIGWVRAAGIGLGQGISARGTQRVLVQGNVLVGGDAGGGNTCITFADNSELGVPLRSVDNSIRDNLCAAFRYATGAKLPSDRYE